MVVGLDRPVRRLFRLGQPLDEVPCCLLLFGGALHDRQVRSRKERSQRFAWRKQFFLADELIERARSHPLGKGSRSPRSAGGGFFGEERIHSRSQVATKARKHEI